MKIKILDWIIIVISIASLLMAFIPNLTLDKIIFFPTLSVVTLSPLIKHKVLRYIISSLCMGVFIFIYFHWYA